MKLERLRELREAKGMTQAELAHFLKVGQRSISRYEQGDSDPDVATLKKLSSLFRISIDYLLENDSCDTSISEIKAKIKFLDKESLVQVLEKQLEALNHLQKK